MADIVSVIALAHAPGVTGWLDKAPADEQQRILAGYAAMGEIFRAAKPDVIVGIANDHLLNFPMESVPDFCVGIAERWSGPAPWFRDWVNIAEYEVAGHRALARTIVREGARRGVNFAFAEKLLFDDNWSVPLKFLTPNYDVALVPIHMNCVMPPVPDAAKSFRTGEVLRDVITNAFPGDTRVAIMATGGLSHDPGGKNYFVVDEAWDRWFIALMEEGDKARMLRELTFERMLEGGDGGASELYAWIVAAGAAAAPRGRSVFYVASPQQRCGLGGMVWTA